SGEVLTGVPASMPTFSLEPLVIGLLFCLASVAVWIAGTRLIRFADVLSERLGLAKSMMGLVVIAGATSLPEIVTTVSGSWRGNTSLVLNNLFGGIALQTAVLAVADYWARGSITHYPKKPDHLLEATFLIALMSLLWAVIISGEPLKFAGAGLGSGAILVAYIVALYVLRKASVESNWVPIDLPRSAIDPLKVLTGEPLENWPTMKLQAGFALACLGVFAAGVGLMLLADLIADKSMFGRGFVGAVLLAAATSLPELSVTISAVRMGAYTLAISNIFGSNLIMVVLIVPADLIYQEAPILREADLSSQLALATGMLVTTIFMAGMIVRRKPMIVKLGIDSVAVLAIYAASVTGLFLLK
ncbi:MAG: sodium:calcium antiporter, partial [Rhizobiaceae bacterium]